MIREIVRHQKLSHVGGGGGEILSQNGLYTVKPSFIGRSINQSQPTIQYDLPVVNFRGPGVTLSPCRGLWGTLHIWGRY